jgi:hypothetical protein
MKAATSLFDGARPPGWLRYLMKHIFGAPLDAPHTLSDMAAAAAGVLEALDIESAHVPGQGRAQEERRPPWGSCAAEAVRLLIGSKMILSRDELFRGTETA